MFEDMDKSNEHIRRFDEILACVVKICDKQSSRNHTADEEILWKHALQCIFSIKESVYKRFQKETKQ